MRVLVVDDEVIKLVSVEDYLTSNGHKVSTAESGEEAMELLCISIFDLILVDLKLPGIDGIELLKRIKEGPNASAEVVVITAYGSIPLAVEAMRCGATDFITKPFIDRDLKELVSKVEVKRRRSCESFDSTDEIDVAIAGVLIGESQEMCDVREMIKVCAGSDATVLINGETGTGKDLAASVIHKNSVRRSFPFVKVSCAFFPHPLFESELFGHEKGTFTGAERMKKGRFELASMGTLYLDDVDDIPKELQIKLLRVIEEKEFERLGGNATIAADFRIVASTKRNLLDRIREGAFREDLFYRLNVLQINMPPLRDRLADIPLLTEHILKKMSGDTISISCEAMRVLRSHNWPGNVRELKHTLEHANIVGKGKLTAALFRKVMDMPEGAPGIPANGLKDTINQVEKKMLKNALANANGNKTLAARQLGLKPSTFRDRLAKYGLK